jgi:hypothetical protein
MSMSVQLHPDGSNYVLTHRDDSGVENKITLSNVDVLTLAQSAQSLQLEILKRLDPKGGDHLAVFVTDVAQFSLSLESLGHAILTTLIAPNGTRLTYAIPEQLADRLIQQLSAQLAQLREKKLTRQQPYRQAPPLRV